LAEILGRGVEQVNETTELVILSASIWH